MFHRILVTLMMLGFVVMITGCNTVSGMGKDIERGGQAVQDVSEDTQENM